MVIRQYYGDVVAKRILTTHGFVVKSWETLSNGYVEFNNTWYIFTFDRRLIYNTPVSKTRTIRYIYHGGWRYLDHALGNSMTTLKRIMIG
jgi:hypothetical protein